MTWYASLVFLSYSSFTRKGQSSKTRTALCHKDHHHEQLDVPEPKYRKVSLGKSGTQNLPGQGQLRASKGVIP